MHRSEDKKAWRQCVPLAPLRFCSSLFCSLSPPSLTCPLEHGDSVERSGHGDGLIASMSHAREVVVPGLIQDDRERERVVSVAVIIRQSARIPREWGHTADEESTHEGSALRAYHTRTWDWNSSTIGATFSLAGLVHWLVFYSHVTIATSVTHRYTLHNTIPIPYLL